MTTRVLSLRRLRAAVTVGLSGSVVAALPALLPVPTATADEAALVSSMSVVVRHGYASYPFGSRNEMTGRTTRADWVTDRDNVVLGWTDHDSVTVNAWPKDSNDPADFVQVVFAPPPGQTLQTGTYLRAEDYPAGTDGRPGIDVSDVSGLVGCAASFEILDIDRATDRLWLRFQDRCDGSRSEAFGEVRVNEPPADPEVDVFPRGVSWPSYYPGERGSPVDVTLRNTGASSVTVGPPAIDGDRETFRVLHTDCGSLPPGGSCSVRVVARPAQAGPARATLVLPRDNGTPLLVPLDARGFAGSSTWKMRDSYLAALGKGNDWGTDPVSQGYLAAVGARYGAVELTVQRPRFQLWFSPPDGRDLEVGTYRGLTEDNFRLLDAHNPYACDTSRAVLHIQRLERPLGGLKQLRLDFRLTCNGHDLAPIFGALTWRSPRPPVQLPPRVSVSTDSSVTPYDGRQLVATVTLEPGHGPRRVDLVVSPEEGNGEPMVLEGISLEPGQTVHRRLHVSRRSVVEPRPAGGGPIVADGSWTPYID